MKLINLTDRSLEGRRVVILDVDEVLLLTHEKIFDPDDYKQLWEKFKNPDYSESQEWRIKHRVWYDLWTRDPDLLRTIEPHPAAARVVESVWKMGYAPAFCTGRLAEEPTMGATVEHLARNVGELAYGIFTSNGEKATAAEKLNGFAFIDDVPKFLLGVAEVECVRGIYRVSRPWGQNSDFDGLIRQSNGRRDIADLGDLAELPERLDRLAYRS